MDDPRNRGNWILIPRDQRWMFVPLGYNSNATNVGTSHLKLNIPIQYPQGEQKSCLYSSVASALWYMEYNDIAATIIKKMTPWIGQSAEAQWQGLQRLLESNNNSIYFTKFNFSRGKKRLPKNKLDVQELRRGHPNSFDLHAVSLIGSDGGISHAIAVVDGLIFDSSSMHAMELHRSCLDWCCNCVGGYAKTGHAMRIKITNCKFKAAMKDNMNQEYR